MDSITISFVIGILLIIAGSLIKSNPQFFSGEAKSQSSSKDVISLEIGKKVSLYLVFGGLFIILLGLVNWILGWESGFLVLLILSLMSIAILIALLISNIYKKYGRKSKGRTIAYVLSILTLATSASMFFMLKEPHVTINDDGIRINGIYGEYVSKSAVKKVRLIEVIPPKLEVCNGIDIMGISRGDFKLESWDEVDLHLQSQHSPYIYITTTSGRIVIFNSADREKTKDYYETIIKEYNLPIID